MNKIYRKIFFWLVFVLFLVSTPLVIMHSKGYRFDQKRGIFVYSGSITLKTIPGDVKVFINNQEQASKSLDIINNSITLNGIKPGTYQIRVEAEGYQGWEKQIEVHSGLSTEFWSVVLVPRDPKMSAVESQNVFRFFPSPFGKKIAFVRKSEKEISLLATDFKKNEVREIFFANNISFSENKLENLEWNYKEDLVLSPVTRNLKSDYLVASATEAIDPVFVSDITKLSSIQKARWSPQEKDVIYFLARDEREGKGGLFWVNLNDNSVQLVVPEVKSYDISQNSIYFIQSNNILFKSDLDGGGVSQVNSSQFSESDAGKNARLIVYDDSRQFLISENGELFLHNDGIENIFRKISDGVQGAQFSDDGKKLLFWTANEISVAYLRKWEVQPFREENEIQNMIRVSSLIDNVFWFRDYEHIFFSQNKKIKLIELDSRDRRIGLDVYENNLESFPATYDIGNGYYYFLKDTKEGQKIFYFILPEKTGIFG
ncbi:MAG: PEGA domain-containing protein [Patescibacteria group bacterium]|nr:PEGA domain-containing protein [Patescibacteria group bacterium]